MFIYTFYGKKLNYSFIFLSIIVYLYLPTYMYRAINLYFIMSLLYFRHYLNSPIFFTFLKYVFGDGSECGFKPSPSCMRGKHSTTEIHL